MAPGDLRLVIGIVAARLGRIFAILVFSVGMFSTITFGVRLLHELTREDTFIFYEAASLAIVSSFALFALGGTTYLLCKAAGLSAPPYIGKWTLIALLLFVVDVILVPIQMARE